MADAYAGWVWCCAWCVMHHDKLVAVGGDCAHQGALVRLERDLIVSVGAVFGGLQTPGHQAADSEERRAGVRREVCDHLRAALRYQVSAGHTQAARWH